MHRFNKFCLFLSLFTGALTGYAEDITPYTITVTATDNPEQNGLMLQSLLASITDAKQEQPYLITLAPGVYQLQKPLVMKAFVTVVGAGELATRITAGGQADPNSGTVIGADNMEIRSLTIENTGNDSYAIALYNHNASPQLRQVTLRVSGATFYNAALFNETAKPKLSQVFVIVEATQQAAHNRGLYNLTASPILNQVDIEVASANTSSYGIYNVSDSFSTLTINNSRIKGATQSIVNAPGYLVNVQIAHSQLAGGVNGGGFTCFSVFDDKYQPVDNRCQ